MTRGLWASLGVLLFCAAASTGPRWVPRVLAYGPSTSLPKGWYVRACTSRALQVSDLVVLDLPPSMAPYVPKEADTARLLKLVAALEGMEVCWDTTAMSVRLGQGSVEYPFHPDVPPVRFRVSCWVLGQNEFVVVGTHPRSSDSRYVGPLPRRLVQWRAWPLWTWEQP